MCFWNMAGLRNKDKGFWREVLKWDVIVFMETWIEEKEWRKFRDGLPKRFKGGVICGKEKYERWGDERNGDGD